MERPAPLFATIAAIAAALTVVGAAPVTSGPSRGRRLQPYQFLFDGCPRGPAASQVKYHGNKLRSECEALCSADDSCNAIEVNGCLSGGAQCGGACVTFGGAGTEITNGKCDTSGNQKAYRKGGKSAVAQPYQFLFDGCPRGPAASQVKYHGNKLRSECEALCSADDSCNAIEVNGCLSGGAQCGGNCFTFGGAGTEITNGKCVTSGDQKAYRKGGKSAVALLEPGTTVALYSTRHGRFARMHSSGNMDRSGLVGRDALPSGWTWERFEVVDAGAGQIALYSPIHGRFARMNSNGNMDSSPPVGRDALPSGWAWERFDVVDAGAGQIAFYNPHNGRFVRMDSYGNMDSSPQVGRDALTEQFPHWTWERFEVVVTSPPPPPPPPALIIGPYGWPSTATCPSGYTSITSWEECKSASETLGISHFRGKPSDNMFPVNTIQGCTASCTGVYGRATQPPSACHSANFKWSYYGSQICKLEPPERDCGFLGHKCNAAVVLGRLGWRLGSNAAGNVAGWF